MRLRLKEGPFEHFEGIWRFQPLAAQACKVSLDLEFAVRGGIVDVFPPHTALPCRVEFFDDEIESLREFDPASQRSQRKCEHIAVPPPQELLIDRELIVDRADAVRELAIEQEADEHL